MKSMLTANELAKYNKLNVWYFEDYLRMNENVWLCSESEHGKHIFHYTNRWSGSKRRDMIESRKQLSHAVNCGLVFQDVTFLTLTTKQPTGVLIEDQIIFLLDGFDKIISRIKRRHPDVQYIRELEPHKSGYGHIHVIFFAKIPLQLLCELQQLWAVTWQKGSHEGFHYWYNEYGHPRKIIMYLLKHSSKPYKIMRNDDGWLKFNAAIWSMGRQTLPQIGKFMMKHGIPFKANEKRYKQIRLSTRSKGLSPLMKLPDKPDRDIRRVSQLDGDDGKVLWEKYQDEEDEHARIWHHQNNKRICLAANKYQDDLIASF